MKKIIPISKPEIGKKEVSNVLRCLKSGWISGSGGWYVEKFEKSFTNYLEGGSGVAVSSGTVAIQLALKTLGIGKGDEVIVPNITFAATINAVINSGVTPVLVDIEKETWTIDLNQIKKAISKKTKAIMPVHVYGQPAKIDEIKKIAKKYKIKVIEDCAESLGATYKGRKVGLDGDCSIFSFFTNKLVTTGEGGMLVFKDPKKANYAKLLRNQGRVFNKPFWHKYAGFNFKMTNIQAAIGLAQMSKINKFLKKRKKIFNVYNKLLKKNEIINFLPSNAWSENSYWYYTIFIKGVEKNRKEILMKRLKKFGIETRPGFYPLHSMKPYIKYAKYNYKVSDYFSKNSISLPTFYLLKEAEQIYIVKTLLKALDNLI
jgi:perosamine synthetase